MRKKMEHRMGSAIGGLEVLERLNKEIRDARTVLYDFELPCSPKGPST